MEFREQLNILLTTFYIVMMYCKAALNLNVWNNASQKKKYLFAEALMDLISIYKDILELDQEKHG